MGSGVSTLKKSEPKINEWSKQFYFLGLTNSDIIRLHREYKDMSKTHCLGKLEACVLFKVLGLEHNQIFMLKIFSAFRENGSLDVFFDFRDFVFALWNFCTLTEKLMVKFAFDIYDTRRSGRATVSSLEDMIKHIYGYSYRTNETAKCILQKLAEYDKNSMDYERFTNILGASNLFTKAILDAQEEAKIEIMDYDFWDIMTSVRKRIGEENLLKRFLEVNPSFCAKKIDRSGEDEDDGSPPLRASRIFSTTRSTPSITISPKTTIENRLSSHSSKWSKTARNLSISNAKARVLILRDQLIAKQREQALIKAKLKERARAQAKAKDAATRRSRSETLGDREKQPSLSSRLIKALQPVADPVTLTTTPIQEEFLLTVPKTSVTPTATAAAADTMHTTDEVFQHVIREMIQQEVHLREQSSGVSPRRLPTRKLSGGPSGMQDMISRSIFGSSSRKQTDGKKVEVVDDEEGPLPPDIEERISLRKNPLSALEIAMNSAVVATNQMQEEENNHKINNIAFGFSDLRMNSKEEIAGTTTTSRQLHRRRSVSTENLIQYGVVVNQTFGRDNDNINTANLIVNKEISLSKVPKSISPHGVFMHDNNNNNEGNHSSHKRGTSLEIEI